MRLALLAALWIAIAGCRSAGPVAHDAASPAAPPVDEPGALLEQATAAREAHDLAGARALNEKALAILERTLPEDHGELLAAREQHAVIILRLGDLRGARAEFEKVLAVYERTRADDHPDVQRVRVNLAITIKGLGDLQAAKTLEEKVLALRERTLPDDHPDLQKSRANLAATLYRLGDARSARPLLEKALAVLERTLPGDHPDLQRGRLNLALIIKEDGDLKGAFALEEEVLAARERTLPDDHPDLQLVRKNIAVTIKELGDLPRARAIEQHVLDVLQRTLPEDHPSLQAAQQNLAVSMKELGDLQGARVLEEKVLAACERTCADDDLDLQIARSNLAVTMIGLGDLPAARALLERVLPILEATLPDDHPLLQAARVNLSSTLARLGDVAGARALCEKILAVREQALPDDHPHVQLARQNLAGALRQLGDLHGARVLEEKILAILEKTLPDDHPDLQTARLNLSVTLGASSDVQGARALAEGVVAVRERTLPCDHHGRLKAREQLVWTLAAPEDRQVLERELAALGDDLTCVLRSARSLAPREARERLGSVDDAISAMLSLNPPSLDARMFALVESLRALASFPAELRGAGSDAHRSSLLEEIRSLRARIQSAASPDSPSRPRAPDDELAALVRRRDQLERELRSVPGAEGLAPPEIDAASLAAALPGSARAVGFRRYTRSTVGSGRAPTSEASLVAFVLAPSGELTRVELGSLAAIQEAAELWRRAIGKPIATSETAPALVAVSVPPAEASRGVPAGTSPSASKAAERELGLKLRELVLDPILRAAGDAKTLDLCLDDALLLVSWDALPSGDGVGGDGLAGDHHRILQDVSFARLLRVAAPRADEPSLVLIGGVDYDAEIEEGESPAFPPDLVASAAPPWGAGSERGARREAWSPLPGTLGEVERIGAVFEEVFGARAAPLVGERATKAAFYERARGARFVHVATHGWFAPESVGSLADPPAELAVGPKPAATDAAARNPAQRGLWRSMGSGETVTGLAPMTLCGLALAGANRGLDSRGRAPGILTAEELAAFDLSACDLAVLSACETNVGPTRAGQGIQSLQAALHAAGARAAITSLWKVDDEAARELFADFYARIWVRGEKKAEALWNAKRTLRGSGRPTRDWAAWILTGDPE